MPGNRRGARGGGSIRKRKDGRWEARFIIGIDPGTGKDIRKSVYATTQKEARKKMTEALAALDQGDYQEPSRMSVGKWLDIWTDEYLGGIKPSTAFIYKEQIRLHIKPAMGAVKLQELNPHFVQKFYNALGEPTESRPALSAKGSVTELLMATRKRLRHKAHGSDFHTFGTLPREDCEEHPRHSP